MSGYVIAMKTNRNTPVIVGFICLSLLIYGCKDTSGPDSAKDKGPELVFRFVVYDRPGNIMWVAADIVKRELEKRSNGRIKIMFYDSGTLGGERQMLESCYLGVIEMVLVTSSVITTIDSKYSLLDMPYLFMDEQHHQRVLNGPVGQELFDSLKEHKLQGLAFYSMGFRHIFNSKGRQIRTPQDLDGLKIRVMESPMMINAINHMGASATPVGSGELFQALQTGVVDGAENNIQFFTSSKLYETGCKNFSKTRHFASQMVLAVNRDWFDRLKQTHPDLYELIRDVPEQVKAEYNQSWSEAVRVAMIEMVEQQKVVVNEVEDVTPFVEAVQTVYEEFFKTHKEVPYGLMERIRQEADK